jgi:hypothetical protein
LRGICADRLLTDAGRPQGVRSVTRDKIRQSAWQCRPGVGQATPCSQSQIGRWCHLRGCGNSAGRGCFVVVRGCPLDTAHARCLWHAEGTAGEDEAASGRAGSGHQLDRWARPVLGDRPSRWRAAGQRAGLEQAGLEAELHYGWRIGVQGEHRWDGSGSVSRWRCWYWRPCGTGEPGAITGFGAARGWSVTWARRGLPTRSHQSIMATLSRASAALGASRAGLVALAPDGSTRGLPAEGGRRPPAGRP